MKKPKLYTFIISNSHSPSIKRFHIQTGIFKIFAGVVCLLLVGSFLLVFDYLHIASNQFLLQKTIKEKEDLERKLYAIESKLNDLTKEMFQVRDFNRKIRNITTLGSESYHPYGKVSLSPDISALASFKTRVPAALSAKPKGGKKNSLHSSLSPDRGKPAGFSDFSEWIIYADKLKGEARLVKQNTWDLYSTLLKRKELLNNTPSILPVRGWITSHFGYRNETFYADHDLRFHKGMDIAANMGSPVLASAAGQVIYRGYDDTGYGKMVIIDHGYSVKTVYAHMSEFRAQKGAYVRRGDVVGLVGNTGKSTGPHLHYEIQISGVPVDPIHYILNEEAPVKYTTQVSNQQ